MAHESYFIQFQDSLQIISPCPAVNVYYDEGCCLVQLRRKPLDSTGLLQIRIARAEQILAQSAPYCGIEPNLQNSSAFPTCHSG
jgi:hypothetical protein